MTVAEITKTGRIFELVTGAQAQAQAVNHDILPEDADNITGAILIMDYFGQDCVAVLFTEDDDPEDAGAEYDEIDLWLI